MINQVKDTQNSLKEQRQFKKWMLEKRRNFKICIITFVQIDKQDIVECTAGQFPCFRIVLILGRERVYQFMSINSFDIPIRHLSHDRISCASALRDMIHELGIPRESRGISPRHDANFDSSRDFELENSKSHPKSRVAVW